VPALARTAAHVAMLQRSPSYIVSRPANDRAAEWMRRRLPAPLADTLARWLDVLVGATTYTLARRLPKVARRSILAGIRKHLGPDWDIETDFAPRYNPWDQRVCLVPDGDLFQALTSGRASIVTDTIDRFTETGIRLGSGREIAADIVVAATGLRMQIGGGMEIAVDGHPVAVGNAVVYKGMMLSGVPNLALSFGYINASWTLRADLIARSVCRLLNHMKRRGWTVCTPVWNDPPSATAPLLDFTSGYVRRAEGVIPRQGLRRPWRVRQNYVLDMLGMTLGAVEDGVLKFTKGKGP
jgi:cation diffusion facilitator CzcD-associated flavoprotein CzcO